MGRHKTPNRTIRVLRSEVTLESLQEKAMEPISISVTKKVFDLDARDFIDVEKKGTVTPVDSAEAALAAVGNDSAKFLAVINAGLETFQRAALETDTNVPWTVDVEKDGKTETVPYAGKSLTEDKAKQLNVTVLNIAKTLFQYNDWDNEKDAEKRSAGRAASKKQAMDMILNNPSSVEALLK